VQLVARVDVKVIESSESYKVYQLSLMTAQLHCAALLTLLQCCAATHIETTLLLELNLYCYRKWQQYSDSSMVV
jgi:hypothetical protein